jgi:uncharacterized membrane protein
MRSLKAFRRNSQGSIALMAAMFGGVLLGMCALGVDLGSIFLQSRQLQGVADLAAIAAGRDSVRSDAAAQATADANGWRYPIGSVAEVGSYTPDPTIAAGKRFVAGGVAGNAVRVTLTTQADLFFGAAILGKSSVTIHRTAISGRAQMASFSVGSRLAALNGGIGNALLSALTGSQLSLSVMDYNALAGAKVDLLTYTQALAVHAQLTGATFDQALSTKVTTGDALSVFADVLNSTGQTAASIAARKISVSAGSSNSVDLSQLIDLGPYQNQDHASSGSIAINAMDMANAMLLLAQQGRQVKLDLGATIPGLAGVSAWLAVGERPNQSPWVQVAENGSDVIIRTAQTRLYVDTKVAPGAGLLTTAGIALVDIPIVVEAAAAQAKLSKVSCADQTASLSANPSIGSITLGQIDTSTLNNFKQPLTYTPATLVNLLLIQATASAHVDIGGATWQQVDFSQTEVANSVVKTVQTTDVAKASVGSLLSNTQVQVKALGVLSLGVTTATLSPALNSLLSSTAPTIDTVVNGLTDLVGVHLGQADVRIEGLRCGQAALVS